MATTIASTPTALLRETELNPAYTSVCVGDDKEETVTAQWIWPA